MCLELKIFVARSEKDALVRLPQQLGEFVVSKHRALLGRNDSSTCSIGWKGGCGCPMLTDEADWNAEFWDFQKETLPHFADAIEQAAAVLKNGFSFTALWQGEKPKKYISVTSQEFLRLIRENKIGTSTCYRVVSQVAG